MKTPMNRILILLFVFVSNALLLAQERVQNWNTYMDALEESDRIFVSIAVSEKGKLLYSRAVGLRSSEPELKSDENTLYHIGSISKSYTACIILQMVDEGKLSLGDKLSKYFKSIPNAENISIEHLMRHESGLVNFTSLDDYTSYMTVSQSRESMIQRFITNKTEFEAGTKTAYSNTNYVLLSYIAEDIDKKPFKDVLASRISKKLNLKRTYINDAINPSKGEAYSFARMGDWIKSSETHSSIPLGAGAIQTTPTELNTFYYNLFESNLISKKSLARMMEMKDGFGLGLFTFPFHDKTVYGHTGGIDAFQSMAGHIQEDQLTVTTVTNGTDIELNDVMVAVLNIYFEKEFVIPEFKDAIPINAEEAALYSGIYSSDSFPLKITIFSENEVLFAQATGQAAFPLEKIGENTFEFKVAGITMNFEPEKAELKFAQGGGTYVMKKE